MNAAERIMKFRQDAEDERKTLHKLYLTKGKDFVELNLPKILSEYTEGIVEYFTTHEKAEEIAWAGGTSFEFVSNYHLCTTDKTRIRSKTLDSGIYGITDNNRDAFSLGALRALYQKLRAELEAEGFRVGKWDGKYLHAFDVFLR